LEEMGLETKERTNEILQKLTELARNVRMGAWEKVWASAGVALIPFGIWLLSLRSDVPEYKTPLLWGSLILILAGFGALILAFLRIRRSPPVADRRVPWPKGENPFGPGDADASLFARLERSRELGELRSWIEVGREALAVVWGPLGVGKTSLLQAGLASELPAKPIYWSAGRRSVEADLLRVFQDAWGREEPPLKSLEGVLSLGWTGPRAVVLDHLEQATPDERHRLLAFLRQVVESPGPGALRWIVAFRPELMPLWKDFETSLSPTTRVWEYHVQPFHRTQARNAIGVLSRHYELGLDPELIDRLLDDLVDDEGLVLPIDIGICLKTLAGLIRREGRLLYSADDYRKLGGHVALMSLWLEERLRNIHPYRERKEIVATLLGLVDLPGKRPLEQGKTLEELGSGVPVESRNSLAQALRDLSSLRTGKQRILIEDTHGQGGLRYRLADPELVPALLRLAEVYDHPEVERVSELLEERFGRWKSGGRRKRDILSWPEVRTISSRQSDLGLENDPDLREFLELSRRTWKHRLMGVGLSALLMTAAGVIGWGVFEEMMIERRLQSWELPWDLHARRGQFERLGLHGAADRLDWLPEGLKSLRVDRADLESLEGLPESLEELELRAVELASLSTLPRSLTRLEIEGTDPARLGVLPPGLRTLSMAGPGVRSLVSLPESLRELSLRDTDLEDLESIPRGVESLTLAGSSFKALEGLPSALSSLTLSGTGIRRLEGLPSSLKTLVLLNNPGLVLAPGDLPAGLTSLTLDANSPSHPLDLRTLPRKLRSLDLRRIEVPSLHGLPEELVVLTLNNTWTVSLEGLPAAVEDLSLVGVPVEELGDRPGLRKLTLRETGIEDLSSLPPLLEELRVSGRRISSLRELPPSLIALEASAGELDRLPPLPSSLRVLDLSWSRAPLRLSGFPPKLEVLRLLGAAEIEVLEGLPESLRELDLAGTRISRVEDLPRSLLILDLRDTRIRSLKGLPPRLLKLRLSPGLPNLEGLPGSVEDLEFVEEVP
jgi:hypothetical protein